MVEFVTHEFSKASDFLNALRLSNPEWWAYHSVSDNPDSEWQREWIFRGQSSIKWSPLPTAWRPPKDFHKDPIFLLNQHFWRETFFPNAIAEALKDKTFLLSTIPPTILTGKEADERKRRLTLVVLQALSEIVLLTEFATIADELGHGIPVSAIQASFNMASKKITEFVEEYVTNYFGGTNDELWMQHGLTLAQHHSVPTRLLDWTTNSIAAAFFAASDVADPTKDDCLVVFALHAEIMKHHIKLIRVPASDNQYLRAQGGVFTYDTGADRYHVANGSFPTIEESLRDIPVMFSDFLRPQKLTLPVSQAPELMRMLWLERMTVAHLMPTLDHVADAVKTKVRLAYPYDPPDPLT